MTGFTPTMSSNTTRKPSQHHSLLANLAFNIIIPTLTLTKLSSDDWLGAKWALVVALAFPLIFGARDLYNSGKVNFFSVLGILGVLINGGVGLLELPAGIIAIKEAAIPALIGLAVLFSLKTRYPLIRTFLFNEQIVNVDKVNSALKEHRAEAAFDRRMVNATYMFTGAMLLSAVLNYALAEWIIVAETGTPEFNEQLGKMQALSFPVIAMPVTVVMMFALFYLFRGITQLTGLPLEQIMHASGEPAASDSNKQ